MGCVSLNFVQSAALNLQQDMLFSVTNADEGYIFVDTANPPTNLTNYVAELFPLIDPTTVQTIVQQYEDDPTLTDVLSQAIAVMGECGSPIATLSYRRSLRVSSYLCVPDVFAHGGIWGQCI